MPLPDKFASYVPYTRMFFVFTLSQAYLNENVIAERCLIFIHSQIKRKSTSQADIFRASPKVDKMHAMRHRMVKDTQSQPNECGKNCGKLGGWVRT